MKDKYIAKRGKMIGKPMMGALHIHKSAIDTLSDEYLKLYNDKVKFVDEFDYDIIKLDLNKNEVSFTKSRDWDVSTEPEVGDRITIKSDNSVKKIKASSLIYHHKWMFVKDDYKGFDVEESKKRSEYWMNHPHVLNLKADKAEKFNFKIGRINYWKEKVCNIID
ncbi:hypothetical protein ACSW8S_17820 (plasmid) [Clostridium perfringens]